MIKTSKLISIRDDLYEKLKGEKQTGGLSSSEKIDELCTSKAQLEKYYLIEADLIGKAGCTIEQLVKEIQVAEVTQEGRISKTLAGKTILYKVKEV